MEVFYPNLLNNPTDYKFKKQLKQCYTDHSHYEAYHPINSKEL